MAITGTNPLTFTDPADVLTREINPASLRWTGATTTGHKCVVTDLDGGILFESEANGAHFIDGWVFPRGQVVNGIMFTFLESGHITLYCSPW
jgi:hypothetical protein